MWGGVDLGLESLGVEGWGLAIGRTDDMYAFTSFGPADVVFRSLLGERWFLM